MSETVSQVAITGMIVSLVIAILFPITLLIYWKITKKPKFISFFIGAGTFILFALILEQLLHTVVMVTIGGGDLITGNARLASNVWIYGLYGGACAAIFEEFGRVLAMKVCMKKHLDKKNAIMYGIGHGGIESIIIVGMAEISNIATSIAINSGTIEGVLSAVPENQRDTLYAQISALWTTPVTSFYLAGVERIIAILLHICLSYMVYRFVKYNEKKSFLLALAIHFIIDFATVVMSNVLPLFIIEIILGAIVVAFLLFVVKNYKKETEVLETEI